jgi:hypothetical protein
VKKPHPKETPQYWANHEHLMKAGATGGEEASVEAFRQMQQGILPPIEARHRASAAAYRRWMPGGEAETQAAAEALASSAETIFHDPDPDNPLNPLLAEAANLRNPAIPLFEAWRDVGEKGLPPGGDPSAV